MSVSDFNQSPERMRLNRGIDEEVQVSRRPERKEKVVFQTTLHEVERLSLDAFQNKRSQITKNIHLLFSECKSAKEQLSAHNLSALKIIEAKLKQVGGY